MITLEKERYLFRSWYVASDVAIKFAKSIPWMDSSIEGIMKQRYFYHMKNKVIESDNHLLLGLSPEEYCKKYPLKYDPIEAWNNW